MLSGSQKFQLETTVHKDSSKADLPLESSTQTGPMTEEESLSSGAVPRPRGDLNTITFTRKQAFPLVIVDANVT
jgi:hypothetical protein